MVDPVASLIECPPRPYLLTREIKNNLDINLLVEAVLLNLPKGLRLHTSRTDYS